MFDKNHLEGNSHLTAETTESFESMIRKNKPELAGGVEKLKTLLSAEVIARAFSNIQTFNKRENKLLIVSGGIRQRTFLERDCIPALKESFEVDKVQIIG